MAKTSWWWKHIVFLLATTRRTQFNRVLGKLWWSGRSRKVLGWFCCSFAAVLMLLWNWGLLLATLVGIGIMLLVYRLQLGNWKNYLPDCQRFLSTASGKLSLSVVCGAIASFCTYLAASIWINSQNRWLAVGLILEGFGTLLTLFLISWHLLTRQIKSDEVRFEQLLVQLTDSSPLPRLIAVRQLSKLINHPTLNQSCYSQLGEYFHLMLTIEQEPVIREALLKSLENWSEEQAMDPYEQPLNIPITLKKYRYI